MQATAKVFNTGHSQAVRLPKAFRVDATEMWISKNEITGEITLKPVVNDESKLDTLFRMLKENPLPDDFLAELSDDGAVTRHQAVAKPFCRIL